MLRWRAKKRDVESFKGWNDEVMTFNFRNAKGQLHGDIIMFHKNRLFIAMA